MLSTPADNCVRSSDKSVLPLPQISLYTNMYLKFKVAKVLMVQLGGVRVDSRLILTPA